MLSIKQQRLNKVLSIGHLHFQNKQPKFEIPENAHQIIQASNKNVEHLQEMLTDDISKRILEDEHNNLNFYEIAKGDPKAAQQTHTQGGQRVISFHSVHSMQDLALLKNTKLYQKRKLGHFAKEVREKLKQDTDKQLLLAEIYEKLEKHIGQDDEEESQGVKPKTKENFASPDHLSVSELDQWIKNRHSTVRKQKTFTSMGSLPRIKRSNSILESAREITGSQKTIKLPIMNSNHQSLLHQPSIAADLPAGADEDEVIEEQPKKSEKVQQLREKLFRAFKKAQAQQANVDADSSTYGMDHTTSKRVQKYLSQGQNVNYEDFKFVGDITKEHDDKNISIIFDYSSEGLQKTLNTLIKIHGIQFSNQVERAVFFQKQTTLVIKKVQAKFKQHKLFIESQSKLVDQLRIESHEITEKLTQIKALLQQLSLELDSLKDNSTQKSRTNLTDSQPKPKANSEKSLFIAAIMTAVNKTKELETDIQLLKESQENYRQKQRFNKQTIEKVDREIIQKRKEDKKLHKALVIFYFYILMQGQDYRQTGLAWILQTLWELEEKIYEKHLPLFLDQKAKEFIFKVKALSLYKKARILQELKQQRDIQNQYFKRYQASSTGQNNSLSMMLQNLSINVSLSEQYHVEADSKMSQNIKGQPSISITDPKKFGSIDLGQARHDFCQKRGKQITYDEMRDLTSGMKEDTASAVEHLVQVLNQQVPVTASDLIYSEVIAPLIIKDKKKIVSTVQKLYYYCVRGRSKLERKRVGNFDVRRDGSKNQSSRELGNELDREQLQTLEDDELNRIIKEFDFKQYGRRFNTDPAIVMSCLVGASKADRALIKNGMKKRQYAD